MGSRQPSEDENSDNPDPANAGKKKSFRELFFGEMTDEFLNNLNSIGKEQNPPAADS